MSLEESPLSLYVEHNHNHLLSSQEAGWNNLGLIYELEPAGEMPGAIALAHVLIVPQGEFQASFHIEGQWHQEEYRQGDVALIPAGSFFPSVKVDRDVPLIDLFLPPDVLVKAMGESATKVELRSCFKVQDPLIQQMALALKNELASAHASSAVTLDLFTSSFVFWIFVFKEGTKQQMKFLWIYVVVNLIIGLSCALPLFLGMRLSKLKTQLLSEAISN